MCICYPLFGEGTAVNATEEESMAQMHGFVVHGIMPLYAIVICVLMREARSLLFCGGARTILFANRQSSKLAPLFWIILLAGIDWTEAQPNEDANANTNCSAVRLY